VLRAGRATDFGVAGSTIAVMAILMMFLFPLLSRPAETVARKPAGVSLQAAARAKPAVAAVATRQAPAEDSQRQILLETSLGLTLIAGVALLAMALGSRGRPS
jgi:hypothetical protein